MPESREPEQQLKAQYAESVEIMLDLMMVGQLIRSTSRRALRNFVDSWRGGDGGQITIRAPKGKDRLLEIRYESEYREMRLLPETD